MGDFKFYFEFNNGLSKYKYLVINWRCRIGTWVKVISKVSFIHLKLIVEVGCLRGRGRKGWGEERTREVRGEEKKGKDRKERKRERRVEEKRKGERKRSKSGEK